MDTNIPGCRHFVTETAIESTFIPRADPGLLLERNGVLIHFAIPPENADFGISEPPTGWMQAFWIGASAPTLAQDS